MTLDTFKLIKTSVHNPIVRLPLFSKLKRTLDHQKTQQRRQAKGGRTTTSKRSNSSIACTMSLASSRSSSSKSSKQRLSLPSTIDSSTKVTMSKAMKRRASLRSKRDPSPARNEKENNKRPQSPGPTPYWKVSIWIVHMYGCWWILVWCYPCSRQILFSQQYRLQKKDVKIPHVWRDRQRKGSNSSVCLPRNETNDVTAEWCSTFLRRIKRQIVVESNKKWIEKSVNGM